MSRINSLLRASLESTSEHFTLDSMTSLEAYEEYRIALEEHEEAVNLADQLGDMSEGLIEIEGLVDESRDLGTLTEDQVALQVDAVNKVREVLEGDITEISMESFASIESASLEASDQSKGMLRKMWDAFVAMLAKIKEAFKKIWQWIFGSEKRTKDAVKVMETASAEIKADERTNPPTTEPEKVDVEADKKAIAEAVATAPTPEVTAVAKKAVESAAVDVKELKEIVVEIEKEASKASVLTPPASSGDEGTSFGDMPWVPTQDSFMRWQEQYNKETQALIQEYLDDISAKARKLEFSSHDGKFLSECTDELVSSWKTYPELIKDVSAQLNEIALVEERVAKLAVEWRKQEESEGRDIPQGRLNALKSLSSSIQKVKGDLMQFVNKTESGITKASSVVKTVASKSKARKGKK